MKIGLVGPAYPFRGGISHFTTLLFRALARRHDVLFYSFRRQYPRLLYPGKTDRDEGPAALREERAQPLLDAVDPVSWVRTGRRIRGDRPDLLILSWWSSWWAWPYRTVARIGRGDGPTKVLFLCHNVVDHEKWLLGRALARTALRNGDAFIALSSELKEDLGKIVGNKPIAVARHPVYPLGLPAVPRAEARRRLGLGPDEKILLFFGFVRPYKGLSVLLDALPLVRKKTDVRLIVAGEVWGDKEGYARRIASHGITDRVTIFDRYVPNDEVPSLFGAADLLVLPYLSATASGPVQIAQACRLPAVASRVGALAEDIVPGRTGYLVPPGNPAALAEAIIGYFERGEREAMAQAIAARDGLYSWDRLVGEIESIALSPVS